MSVYIKKFIVVNNYGTIQCQDCQRDVSFSAEQANNGAAGPTIADFVNGRAINSMNSTEA